MNDGQDIISKVWTNPKRNKIGKTIFSFWDKPSEIHVRVMMSMYIIKWIIFDENRSRLMEEMMKRYGLLIGVKPEILAKYIEIHRKVWPEVLATITRCNIRNYSIFLKDGMLFAYYEYVGTDYKADMARMAADPKTQEWWKITDPMQVPLETRAEGEWWASMEEVFHLD